MLCSVTIHVSIIQYVGESDFSFICFAYSKEIVGLSLSHIHSVFLGPFINIAREAEQYFSER